MMRVVHVVPTLEVGGAEAFVTSLVRAQNRLGADASITVLEPLRPRWRRSPRLLLRLARRLRGADVVHTHLFPGLAWGAVAARLARVPVVVHTQHAREPEAPWVGSLRRRLAPLVDGVVAVSEAVAEHVRHHSYGDPHVIPNGIDLDVPRAALDGTRLIAVGRLVPIKGHAVLIDALRLLDRSDISLTIVGDGPLRQPLQARAHGLPVTFVGEVHDVAERLAAADLLVHPSLSEGLSLAVLEACAAGLPLLVSDASRPVIEGGAGGWVVPPGSAALADQIAAWAAMSEDHRRFLGARSRAYVARHDIAGCAQHYLQFYEQLRQTGSLG